MRVSHLHRVVYLILGEQVGMYGSWIVTLTVNHEFYKHLFAYIKSYTPVEYLTLSIYLSIPAMFFFFLSTISSCLSFHF